MRACCPSAVTRLLRRHFSTGRARRLRGTGSAYSASMSWIDQLIRHLERGTGSGCGEYYHGGDIAAAVTEPSRLIVRLRCRSCGQDGIAILDFGAAPIEVDPITADDVLDCHDLLAVAARPPSELFPAIAA